MSHTSIAVIVLAALTLAGCGPSLQQLQAVEYAPMPRGDWKVSTPEAQGLEPLRVAEAYYHAAGLEKIDSLLVVKNGYLVGERYYHQGAVDRPALVQSVTKSFTSALVGIALERGCLESVDQKMITFFPELADEVTDPRKKEITIRQLLQMRAGFPWEESEPALFELLFHGFEPSTLLGVALNKDPGSGFEYSNLSSHLLGIVVARACERDLLEVAEEHLFGPTGMRVGDWTKDWKGYRIGHGGLHLVPRDLARFGQLYLDGGMFAGRPVIAASWVEASLRPHTEDINYTGGFPANWGLVPTDVGYGYQWWSAMAGDHRIDFAAGHGGQYVALVHDLDMVVVVTSDPFFRQHDEESWEHELANLNLIAELIASLPVAARSIAPRAHSAFQPSPSG